MNNHYLFISHSWSHSNEYDDLLELLKKRSYFTFKDYSIPKDDPIHIQAKTDSTYRNILKSRIREKMKLCSCVLILAGVYASFSHSIDMEIEIAQELSKPIIAVEYYASIRTSQRVKSNADIVVGWRSDSIVNAIRSFGE